MTRAGSAIVLSLVIGLATACGETPATPPDSGLDGRIARCAALPGDPREHWDCLEMADDQQGVGFLLLLDRVDHDDRAAIASGLRLRPFADGHNAEELDRALAGVIDRQPDLLVEEARKARLEPDELRQIAQMQPEELVDHLDARERLETSRTRALDAALAQGD